MRGYRWALALAAGLATVVPQPAAALDLGAIGDALGIDPEVVKRVGQAAKVASALVPISDEQEVKLGRDVAARVIGRFGLERDARRTRYLNLVGLALAQRSDRPNLPWRFAILATDDVNAYACPGGYVFVTRGALAMVRDEAELAAVLAHEISHVTQRHIIKALQQSKLLAVGADIAAEAFDKGGELFRQMSDFAMDALFKGLKKEDEFDADRRALAWLNRLGYDWPAMHDVLRLLDERRKQGRAKVLAKTHPAPRERLRTLKRAERGMALDEPTGIRLRQRFLANARA
ncbi:MAG: M48 family metalloprotease [Mariprofundaceae bacterium]